LLCTECFHIRSCCSIFNDQPRLHSFRRDSLYIIPQTFPFVNTFFKSFLTFFKVFFKQSRSCGQSLFGDPYIIPQSFRFVNTFFKSFLSFFPRRLPSAPCLPRRPVGQPIYYITFLPVCQVLFSYFFQFGACVIVYKFNEAKLCRMHKRRCLRILRGVI